MQLKGPLKFFDVNLRPPFADPKRIVELAARADVLKLNHDEVGQIGFLAANRARRRPIHPAMQMPSRKLVRLFRRQPTRLGFASRWVQRVRRCGIGAAFVTAPAPKVVVKDTVGAGDAFMAGLMVGLTRGADTQTVLETACRLGAIVASHDGATPLLPQELIREFRANLKAEN